MKANYKPSKYGYGWGTHSGNCKQCANKTNCGQKKEGETEWCNNFRPLVANKSRKKKK